MCSTIDRHRRLTLIRDGCGELRATEWPAPTVSGKCAFANVIQQLLYEGYPKKFALGYLAGAHLRFYLLVFESDPLDECEYTS